MDKKSTAMELVWALAVETKEFQLFSLNSRLVQTMKLFIVGNLHFDSQSSYCKNLDITLH
jgi:uncharacterized protein YueI